METPKIIFIDTCIFDANQYNFHSSVFESLKKTFKKDELTLIMPAPTALEIDEHIKNMSEEIAKALTKAQQQAPFLTKLAFWPDRKSRNSLRLEAQKAAYKDLRAFLDYFEVVDLNYEQVSLPQVMPVPCGEGSCRWLSVDMTFAVSPVKLLRILVIATTGVTMGTLTGCGSSVGLGAAPAVGSVADEALRLCSHGTRCGPVGNSEVPGIRPSRHKASRYRNREISEQGVKL
jgi:hypothetical protein